MSVWIGVEWNGIVPLTMGLVDSLATCTVKRGLDCRKKRPGAGGTEQRAKQGKAKVKGQRDDKKDKQRG